MLVMTRKIGETLLLGNDIEVHLLSVSGDRASIGITAPKHVNVLRKELKERLENDGVEVKMEKQ